ncbi:EamA family transporter [Falsiroseomonas bella]|uniref:EamA family transporter n=1 Tax=Falsiroseomonas bella TaxID=2184016 RepID=A0A317F928_9PROT|nr:DMT family transporter [Falsiroseomonas bella]PWS35265.1 EamA family transporter [Falsiroseomonas bella]
MTPKPEDAPRDEPMRGIPLLLSAIALFSISDALAKHLGETLPPVEIAWLRYLAFFTLAAIPLLRPGGAALLVSRAPGLQVLRGLGVVGSAVVFIVALRFLPLAEATAINFVSPAFVTVLSVIFLGERVGWRRWSAIAVGMVGMLIIVRPGAEAFRPEALLPMLSSAAWASAVIVTRRMGTLDHPATTLFWTAATGFLVLTLVLPFGVTVPDARQVAIGLLIGVVSSAAQWLVVLAYRAAPASVLAPFSYVQLVFSGLLGLLVFGTVPDRWTLMGAAVIAASGLYMAHRERVRSRAARMTAAADPLPGAQGKR